MVIHIYKVFVSDQLHEIWSAPAEPVKFQQQRFCSANSSFIKRKILLKLRLHDAASELPDSGTHYRQF